jgi:hypothetical protein
MKARNSLGSAATDGQEWLQCLPLPGTRALCVVPTLQLLAWTPDSQTHHHPLPQFFSSQARPKRQPGASTRLQAASHDTHKPTEGNQVGNSMGDPRPVPPGQELPLPTGATVPSQQLSWTTFMVQQITATD